MKRTYKEILEGFKCYKDSNKSKRVKKGEPRPQVGEQLPVPFHRVDILSKMEYFFRKTCLNLPK